MKEGTLPPENEADPVSQTWQERRNLVLSSVEAAGFGWWIVLVAGIGFFTDAYSVCCRSLVSSPVLQCLAILDLLHQHHCTYALSHLLGRPDSDQLSACHEHCHSPRLHDRTDRLWIPRGSLRSKEDVRTRAHCHHCCFFRFCNRLNRSQWIHVTHRLAHLLEAGDGCRYWVRTCWLQTVLG